MADVRVSVVSVVRDFEMYGNCVAHNPNLAGCGLVPIDNRAENLPVTRRYNAFLDSLSDDRWIVFCHEDWEAGEPLLPLLSGLDPSYLYGPIGVFVEERRRADVIIMRGVVRSHGLRFDPALQFDMYVEDFCVAAYERAGIESRAIRIDCHHHSRGSLSSSFRASLEYVRQKYASSRKRYATIVGHLNTFGGDSSRRVYKWKRIPWIMFRYRFCK